MIEDTLAKMQREIDRLSAQIEELRSAEISRDTRLYVGDIRISQDQRLRYSVAQVPYHSINPGQWFYLGDLHSGAGAVDSTHLDLWAYAAERPNTTTDYRGASVHLTGNGWAATALYTFAHQVMGGISDDHSAMGYFAVYLDGGIYKLYWYSPRYANTTIAGSVDFDIVPVGLGDGVTPAGSLYYSTHTAPNLRFSAGDIVSSTSIAGRNALGIRNATTVPNNVTTLIATVQATGGAYFTGSLRVSITTGSTNCLAGWTGIITYAWSSANVVQDSATTFGGFSTFTVTASTNTGTRQVLINLLQVNGFAQTQNVYVAIQPLHAGLNTISVS